ncbi:MAG: DUF2608 domain-containing protein [Victivallaceae bacterium]
MLLSRLFCLPLLFLACISSLSEATVTSDNTLNIKTIKTIGQLTSLVSSLDTLICINVDEILLEPTQYLGSYAWFLSNASKIKESSIPVCSNELAFGYDAVNFLCQKRTVESSCAQIIRSIGLNSSLNIIGISHKGISLAEKVIDDLYDHGIDLFPYSGYESESFLNDSENVCLSELIVFTGGVLFCSEVPFEKALQDLLNKYNIIPKKLLYVSSNLKTIRTVGKYFRPYGIDFLGILYEKNEYLKAIEIHDKLQAANLQFNEFKAILPDDIIVSILQI